MLLILISVGNGVCNLEKTLDNRLSIFETNLKSLRDNVEGISNVISEVKNRQRLRYLNM